VYGKFFASTFTGSMYGAGPDVFAVWAYVIANTHDSQVELNPLMMAGTLGTTVERVEAAIAYLCAPDPRSRSKECEGRRLIREGEFAYRVPTFAAYRSIRNEEERREYNRIKKAEQRQRDREGRATSRVKARVNDSQRMSTLSAHTEADTEADTEAQTETDAEAAQRGGAAMVGEFPNPDHASAYQRVRRKAKGAVGFDAGLRAIAQGMHGPAYPWDTIGQALVEMDAAGANVTAQAVRAFCRRLATLPKPVSEPTTAPLEYGVF
jgi:hypothetical protein